MRTTAISTLAGIMSLMALMLTVIFAPAALGQMPPNAAPNVGARLPSLDGVYRWQDVPAGHAVQIDKAVFDRNGYLLTDRAGETILIPIPDGNPYLLKFAEARVHSMIFVNGETSPTLYLQSDDYLVNTDMPGTRWYPLTKSFHPSQPVALGFAPNWNAYISMIWYSDMWIVGGFLPSLTDRKALAQPTPGLTFYVDGNVYKSWGGYMSYTIDHPTPSRGHGHR